jgi:hypothetical protein
VNNSLFEKHKKIRNIKKRELFNIINPQEEEILNPVNEIPKQTDNKSVIKKKPKTKGPCISDYEDINQIVDQIIKEKPSTSKTRKLLNVLSDKLNNDFDYRI